MRTGAARGLQCLSAVSTINGEASLAVQYASREELGASPFPELEALFLDILRAGH